MKFALVLSLVGVALTMSCADDPVNKDDFSIYKCKTKVETGLPDGNHNPGMDCQGACHNHGFTVSGTVFLADQVTPAAGANVTIRDGDLKIMNLITAENGNFYTKEPITFPFRTWVSSCPDVEIMPDFVREDELGASCNNAICHQNQAGTGPIVISQ